MKAITLFDTIQPGVAFTPDSGVTPSRNPYFVPDALGRTATVLVGARIDRLGTRISPKFASRYFSEVLTAAHPSPADMAPFPGRTVDWIRDSALIISDPVPKTLADPAILERLEEAIATVSGFTTLKTGDLIVIPAPTPPTQILAEGDNLLINPKLTGFPEFKLKVR